jgi:hypothetical protein
LDIVGMRNRWKNRTLLGSGYVDEDPMYRSRGSAGEIRCEREPMMPCLSNTVPGLLHECMTAEGTAR